jgi:putative ABC transport system permease protein
VIALFRALVLGHIRGNRLRTFVTLFAVALGVGIALAIDLANATAVASFASSVNVISNHVNLQVTGVGRGFDDRTLLAVNRVAGVRYASPAIGDSLVVGAGAHAAGEILSVIGVDLLRPLPADDTGRIATPGAIARAGAVDPWVLVNGHGALVSARVARTYGWHVGSAMHALAGDRPVTLVVASIIAENTPGVDSSVVFVDIATAQEVFEKIGRLDRIDLVVDAAHVGAVAAAVGRVIPPGTRAIEPRVQTGEIQRMLRSFTLNLAAFSYITLLVGMFLIYNTLAISVAQRRSEIGTLRALGARRREIFGVFVAEGALFGIIGSLVGVGIGTLLAHASVAAVSQTMDTLYVASHADRVLFDPLLIAKAFVIGVCVAMLSAVAPALEAASTAPAVAMRAAGFEARRKGLTVRLPIAGFVLLLAAWLCALAPAIDDIPVFGYVSGLLIVAGSSLFAPLFVRTLARLGKKLFSSHAPAGRLAAANFGASPIRNGVAVASLVIAVAMMVAIAMLIGSFRTTVIAWANDTLKADLFVRPEGLQDASFSSHFSPNVAAKIRALPDVAAIDTFRGITIPFRGRITTLGAANFSSFERRNKLRLIGNVHPETLARELPGSTNVVISDPFAVRFAMRSGDRFTLDTPSGPVTFTVVAVYNDYTSDGGVILLDEATFRRLYHDDAVNSIAVYARAGTDLAALRAAIGHRLAPLAVNVATNKELRARVITVFNRTFAITYALYIIAIAVAVLGVVSTLFALVLERRREIGLLRYLGLRTGQVRRMVYYEAAFLGVLGGCGGVVVGIALSLLLIYVINRQAFGWLIELQVPYIFFIEAIAMVVIAALIAGIYPANIAARIRTADAVRSE